MSLSELTKRNTCVPALNEITYIGVFPAFQNKRQCKHLVSVLSFYCMVYSDFKTGLTCIVYLFGPHCSFTMCVKRRDVGFGHSELFKLTADYHESAQSENLAWVQGHFLRAYEQVHVAVPLLQICPSFLPDLLFHLCPGP